ncbi:MAG: helix-turn-helix transcriptional regulator [Oscillospiraceae bacterium]|nr:helix-turn-helix transcriptional regulator [Oscillospiraceae bacterium]
MEQKIKQNDRIGENIRKIRKAKGLGQTDLVRMLQIDGCDITRECLVKIERCTQHIQVSQLRAIRKALDTSYDALIDGTEETE